MSSQNLPGIPPPPAASKRRDYHGHHTVWCTNRGDGFALHDSDEPYCSEQLHGVELIPEGDTERATMWVQPTSAFAYGRFTPTEYAAKEARHNGVELFVESFRGPEKGWESSSLRLTSDTARTLTATLIRAADIEQGLA